MGMRQRDPPHPQLLQTVADRAWFPWWGRIEQNLNESNCSDALGAAHFAGYRRPRQLSEDRMLQLVQTFTSHGRNLREFQVVFLRPALQLLHLLRVGGVHFRRNYDFGFLRQFGIMFGKFRVDGVKFIDRIALVRAGHVDEMEKQPRSFDVPQELNAQAMAEMSAFDEARDIRNNEGLIAIDRDDSELRFQRRERIIGNLRPSRRDAGYQRRFAYIGIADKADICQELQFETKCFLFPQCAVLGFVRNAIDRGGKVGVSVPTAAAVADEHALVRLREIVKHLAGNVIVNDGADRNLDFEIRAISAVTIAAFAVASPFSPKGVIEAKLEKSVFVGVGSEIDVAAGASITTAWTTAWNELLAPEGNATVSAVPCFDGDFGFVDKRGVIPLAGSR